MGMNIMTKHRACDSYDDILEVAKLTLEWKTREGDLAAQRELDGSNDAPAKGTKGDFKGA